MGVSGLSWWWCRCDDEGGYNENMLRGVIVE